MMNMNVRVLVVAAICMLSGIGFPGTAAASLPTLHGLTAEAGSSGPVIHLRTDQTLETVHYSPQPGVWVVEMPEVEWGQSVEALSDTSLGIERAELSEVDEFGRRMTRLTVWLAEPSQLQLDTSPDGLDLVFTPFASGPAPEPKTEPVVAVMAPVKPAPPAAAAANLFEVVAVSVGDGAVIELKGDGSFSGSAFTLPDPDRLVVDLQGVIKRFNRGIYPVGSGPVRQVRVAQNRTVPEPVTRVVVDLDGEVRYSFSETADGAVIRISDADAPLIEEPAEIVVHSDADVPDDSFTEDDVITREEIVSATDYVVVSNETATTAEPAAEFQAPPVTPAEDAAVSSALFDLPDQGETQGADSWPEADATETDWAADVEPAAERNPFVADSSQMIEHASAAEVLNAPSARAETYQTTEVESQVQQFTGEPISLSLKDADVRDVLKTFSALTQLNIIVDPGVGGSVTVELRDVPWDQALDLILRINNLDYVLENNVLRVATTAKLNAEKRRRIGAGDI